MSISMYMCMCILYRIAFITQTKSLFNSITFTQIGQITTRKQISTLIMARKHLKSFSTQWKSKKKEYTKNDSKDYATCGTSKDTYGCTWSSPNAAVNEWKNHGRRKCKQNAGLLSSTWTCMHAGLHCTSASPKLFRDDATQTSRWALNSVYTADYNAMNGADNTFRHIRESGRNGQKGREPVTPGAVSSLSSQSAEGLAVVGVWDERNMAVESLECDDRRAAVRETAQHKLCKRLAYIHNLFTKPHTRAPAHPHRHAHKIFCSDSPASVWAARLCLRLPCSDAYIRVCCMSSGSTRMYVGGCCVSCLKTNLDWK